MGADFDEGTDEKTNVLLGTNKELQTGGKDADETQGRLEAIQILQDPGRNGRNARQTMLMQKQAHGSGEDLNFPDAEQIKEAMNDHGPSYFVAIYGHGSHTTPTKSWAALGGYGVYMPNGKAMSKSSKQEGRITIQEEPLDIQVVPPDRYSLLGFLSYPYPPAACMQPTVLA